MPKHLNMHVEQPELQCASFKEFFVTIIAGVLKSHLVAMVEEALNEVASRSPDQKVVSLTVIHSAHGAQFESKDTREKVNELLKRTKDLTRASATVIGGADLLKGALRAVVSATILISRPNHPSKIFKDTSEALTWGFQHVDKAWSINDRLTCSKLVNGMEGRATQRSLAQ